MTKIVVDSYIIFSAILNTNSRIAQIIINGTRYYKFFAPQYVRHEIFEHKDKLKKTAKLSNDEFVNIYELIIRNITILNHTLVPKRNYQQAMEICESIDIDDTAFVAVASYVGGNLWTGDK